MGAASRIVQGVTRKAQTLSTPEELNTYDVLVNDWLVFSKASLDTVIARLTAEPEGDAT